MPTPLRAVYFDLDDTLCDSRTAFAAGRKAAFDRILAWQPALSRDTLCQAWEATCAALFTEVEGHDMRMAEMRERRFRMTLRSLDIPNDALADEVDWLLGEVQLARLNLFEGALEVLASLRERLHVGIITNGAADGHPDSQRSKAAHLNLLTRVDSFLASDEAGARKPDKRIFAQALDRAGVAPEAAIYVGDSLTNDIGGANAAGMASVLLVSRAAAGQADEDILATLAPTERPWAVIRQLGEVLPLVDGWTARRL